VTAPKISVIMPVHNTPSEWLCEAIDSILAQTYSDFEFIIINDGSTNLSVEQTIKSYTDSRIKYFYKANSGIADTLNYGISHASGEFIARMDADDISLPNRFQVQIDFLDTRSDVSVCGTCFHMFGELERTVMLPKEIKFLDLVKGCNTCHASVMWRRADFEKYDLRYNPQYAAEDYELWSRARKYLKFANVQQVLYRYRRYTAQTTQSRNAALKQSFIKVRNEILDFLTDNTELRSIMSDYAIESALFDESPLKCIPQNKTAKGHIFPLRLKTQLLTGGRMSLYLHGCLKIFLVKKIR